MAVEVIDSGLRVVARTALPAGSPLQITLDDGSYLVRGWAPDGQLSEAVAADSSSVVLESSSAVPSPTPVEAYAEWVQPWHRLRGTWRPGAGLFSAGGGRNLAFQFGTADGPTVTTLTTAGLGIPDLIDVPADGVALSLLSYLAAGDFRSARTLIDACGSLSPSDLTPATAIATGYFLAQTGNSRLSSWAREATRVLPESADAAVLTAWHHLRAPGASLGEAERHLIRAHRLGLPAVAAGMALLSDGLAAVGRGRSSAGRLLDEVRLIQRALLPGILTSYWSVTPNNSVPALRPAPRREPGGRPSPLAVAAPMATVPGAIVATKTGFVVPFDRYRRRRQVEPLVALDSTARRLLPSATPRQIAVLRKTYLRAVSSASASEADVATFVADQESRHSWPAPAGTTSIPRLDLRGVRAAGSADPVAVQWGDPATDVSVDCRQSALDRVDIAVRAHGDVLVEMHVADDHGWQRYLVTSGCRITLTGVTGRLDLAVGEVREPATLDAGDADMVARSVSRADRPGRDRWRALLGGLSHDHLIAVAIMEGLE
ncbi:hypothetical protein E1258_18150 [Micromonospora sp. KC207]|uniref:hypothetical protein n=1 Tax=Micromonospora sp. KC207 TaxID=2530377 RepID=UPI001052CE64|nr:hypothetical protein [Micromonospora sp. KC207]TDC59381.1 hypothetical protein E1258_18150 [Micromonospora sp. KC207]